MDPQTKKHLIELAYLAASILFIFSLKWMSSPASARRGVWAGELGMLIAIVATLFHHEIVDYTWIAIALVLGSILGAFLGRVQMTAVPQRTALSHAFGSLCVALVGISEYYLKVPSIERFEMGVLAAEVILGSLTVTGSLMAAGKATRNPAPAPDHLQRAECRQPRPAGALHGHRGVLGL
jgi:H+-translocating NAD(P) transhydrogenase subunit beta